MGAGNIRTLPSLAEKKSAGYFCPRFARRMSVSPTKTDLTHTRKISSLNRPTTASGSPFDNPTPTSVRAGSRLSWLDFFRGLAVLVMIEAHVCNTFLATGVRESDWFPLLNYINGLVAPSFLFIAGFVQGREGRVSPGKPINYRLRARRLVGIVLLGYALHFPFAELAQHRWADALRVGTQFDVLQCLAVSLGVLLAISWVIDQRRGPELDADASVWVRRSGWWMSVVVLAGCSVLAAPYLQSGSGGPIPLRALVNQTTGSLFPLLPWMGFVLFGALVGAWPRRPLHERAVGLLSLAALAWTFRGAEFSAVSPAFFLERAAWVLVLAAVCEWCAERPLPGLILFAGRNSLTLYVVHLVLITTLVGLGVPAAGLSLAWALALLAVVVMGSLVLTDLVRRLPDWWAAVRTLAMGAGKPVRSE